MYNGVTHQERNSHVPAAPLMELPPRPTRSAGEPGAARIQTDPVRFAIAFGGAHKKGKGIARDLSLGGCMIETDTPLPVDTLLELKVFVDEHEMPVEVAASVRWADGQRMGIKFLRIRDPDRFRRFLGVGVPQDARSDS